MSMLDSVLALAIVILLMASIAGLLHMASEKNVQKIVAEQLQTISVAAQEYAKKYHATLLPNLTPAGGTTITVQDLIDNGFLAQGSTATNAWGQTYGIHFRRIDTTVPDPDGGTMTDHAIRVAVITMGGNRNDARFNNVTVVGATAFLPPGGAYVASGDIASQPAGTLVGRGWTMPLGSIGVANPGAGHLAIISSFNTSSLGHDFLYRVDAGIEELNTMETELHMSDHAILDIKELQFQPHTIDEMANFCANAAMTPDDPVRVFSLEDNGLYICRNGAVQEILDTGNSIAIKDIRLVANGDTVAKPICSPHTNSEPEIYLTPVAMASKSEKTPPITSFQTFATDTGDNWTVTVRLQDGKSKPAESNAGWRYPAANLAMAQAILFCRSPAMVTP